MGVWIETHEVTNQDWFSQVTPFVGVWIETICETKSASLARSHPSWVCGLKPNVSSKVQKRCPVTPFVGVWIETTFSDVFVCDGYVTPFVGVWIETKVTDGNMQEYVCHTLRGCVD